MALPIILRRRALDDLANLAIYVGQRDQAAADRVVQRIERVISKTIAVLPFSGRLDARTGARQYPVPGLPYLVIYVPQPDFIDVVGIFHTSRAPDLKPQP